MLGGGMQYTHLIGWLASAVLLVTIATQIVRQCKSGAKQGVSRWFFCGQMVSSAGFLIYSWLLRNWVFIATNSLILLSGLLGFGIVLWNRKADR